MKLNIYTVNYKKNQENSPIISFIIASNLEEAHNKVRAELLNKDSELVQNALLLDINTILPENLIISIIHHHTDDINSFLNLTLEDSYKEIEISEFIVSTISLNYTKNEILKTINQEQLISFLEELDFEGIMPS